MVNSEKIKEQIAALPSLPGVYQYFNKNGKIIYIGKAKDLKKRVSSYFNKNHDNFKTQSLVKNIFELKYIIVETEQDALLLENSLIKKYQPKYNVLLKDDKTYPWITIKEEPFPRVIYTRKIIKDGSQYFGPFTSMFLVKTLIEFIRKTYQIRTCSLNLSKENVSRGKFKPCLQFHIGNCLAPCENRQSEFEYMENIRQIESILKGNISGVISLLRENMKKEAEQLRFEEALKQKQKLESLQNYRSKSIVVNPEINNIDVFSFQRDNGTIYINFLKVLQGSIVQSFTLEMKERIEETNEDLLLTGITEIRSKFFSNSIEIIVPFKPIIQFTGIKYTVPVKGEKKKLLELSERNVKYYILERKKEQFEQTKKPTFENRIDRFLKRVKQDLRLPVLPVHIECFDNSNIQGSNPVAACVVYKNGKPANREYRHFNIKTVSGPNDFASMKEIVSRRYKRLIEENLSLPQLIIIDGGKGQLSAAVEALENLELKGKIAIIGIAKRLEEIYFPDDQVPLYLNKNSETLKLIQRIRDEAHRFGITHHRNQRSKQMIVSELDQIKGIGSISKEQLFNHLKSVEGIKSASLDELSLLIGKNKGSIIYNFFNNKTKEIN